MEIREHEGIKYHLDDVARQLAERYDTRAISGPDNLTGDFPEECAVMPFLHVAYNTGKFWGFDYGGYTKVVDFFKDADATNMAFARARVNGEGDLAEIAQKGHLRRVMHEGNPIYFVSEQLVAMATNSRRPLLANKRQ